MNKKWLTIVSTVLVLVLVAAALAFYFTSKTETSKTTTAYTVKAGDTCRKIASEHNVSVESIVELNHLSPDCSNLYIDQNLVIPAPAP